MESVTVAESGAWSRVEAVTEPGRGTQGYSPRKWRRRQPVTSSCNRTKRARAWHGPLIRDGGVQSGLSTPSGLIMAAKIMSRALCTSSGMW